MKNTIGSQITLTLFGESHGAAVGVVIDGLPAGVPISHARIARELARRRPATAMDTARREADAYELVSGVFGGKSCGTPICILIPNRDAHSADYTRGPARPSHADAAAYAKYHGFEDYRGGGHFSGRVTAALVAAGGILLPMLEAKGISIGTHILSLAGVRDTAFALDPAEQLTALQAREFPTIDPEKGEQMAEQILAARAALDSIGGRTQTAILGVCAGVGEPWFDSVEGMLSHALFSLGGIKGVSFGLGFGFDGARASEVNDAILATSGGIKTRTNHSGGINGGITNGMPILFECAVKPTPSIAKEQQTVDLCTGKAVTHVIHGRHDPCILRRICPVIDAVSAAVLADLLAVRFGTEYFAG